MSLDREVHYAESGGLQIAYQVMGDGPIDIVVAHESGSNIELLSEHPRADRYLRRFCEYGRVIHLDPRGVGLSDPLERVPTLEEWVQDVRVVMDAAGSSRAAVVGHGFAGQLFMLFAAMYPNQTAALVTINSCARLRWAPDYPFGFTEEAEAASLAMMARRWGTGMLSGFNPGLAEGPDGLVFVARMERLSATPRRAVQRQQIAFELDVRDVLAAIAAPALVIQSADDPYIRRGHAQYLVEHIADAKYLEIQGVDHSPTLSRDQDGVMDAIEQFLTGRLRRSATDRALRTVAFTDIVDSTKHAGDVGDRQWRSLLELHESTARREVAGAGGRLIKFTGDGLLATFEGPASAVQCMRSLGDALQPLGLPIRAGVHTGEVEVMGDDIGGIAVHIAARISALAGAGEVLTSSTVRDLVAGSGLEFDDLGDKDLKGVPGTWRILAVR